MNLAPSFNGLALIGVAKHVNCVIVLSEYLIDLGHPLTGNHTEFLNEDCFVFQIINTTLVLLREVAVKCLTNIIRILKF